MPYNEWTHITPYISHHFFQGWQGLIMQPAELHVITLWTKSSISQNGILKRKGEDKQAFSCFHPHHLKKLRDKLKYLIFTHPLEEVV